MFLESMVVSRDWAEVSVVECILSSLHIGVDVEKHVERATEKLAHSKVDAVVVDCDLEGASHMVEKWQSLRGTENTVPLIVMGSQAESSSSLRDFAQYRFNKPISVENAVRTLSAARNRILQGRLRYHRQPLMAPVELTVGKKHLEGFAVNISQGGLGVLFDSPLKVKGTVKVQFKLPQDGKILAKGEVVWCDNEGHAGIHFRDVAVEDQRQLEMWLAGRYFER